MEKVPSVADLRARQLTQQLLTGIRTHRAKVVVIDITGAPDVDEAVANHLVQTVDASRLMGAGEVVSSNHELWHARAVLRR